MTRRRIESSRICDITCEDARAKEVSYLDSSRNTTPLLIFAIAFGLGIGEPVVADWIILQQQIAAAPPINSAKPAQKANVEVLNGTDLVSVSEFKRILRRAQYYAREGNAGDAVVLYQQLLDNAGGTLATMDEKKVDLRAAILMEQATHVVPPIQRRYTHAKRWFVGDLKEKADFGKVIDKAMKKMSDERGFLMTEMLVVMTIVLILLAMLTPSLVGYQRVQQEHAPRASMLSRKTQI